jgi:hypothetical protein
VNTRDALLNKWTDAAERTSEKPEEIIMFRKISIALIAAAALGSAALAPTTASAWGRGGFGGFHGGFHEGWGHRSFGYGFGYSPGWCYFHPYRCERPL